MGAVPQYIGGLGYTEERVQKIERRESNVKKLMVKDLMSDLETGNRVEEVIKNAAREKETIQYPNSWQFLPGQAFASNLGGAVIFSGSSV